MSFGVSAILIMKRLTPLLILMKRISPQIMKKTSVRTMKKRFKYRRKQENS